MTYLTVSSDLYLSPVLQRETKPLYQASLQPLNCSFGMVTTKDEAQPLQQCVKQQAKRQKCNVVVMFAIRRPGCANCREHGRQLTELAQQENVALMGVIKERGVADASLVTMYQEYFHYPIYQDEKWKTYQAMGPRKLTMKQLLLGHLRSLQRYKKKNLENIPFGGDLFTQGGLLIFNKRGQLQYCYEERYGDELDLHKLRTAIQAVRYGAEDTTCASSSHYGNDDDCSITYRSMTHTSYGHSSSCYVPNDSSTWNESALVLECSRIEI